MNIINVATHKMNRHGPRYPVMTTKSTDNELLQPRGGTRLPAPLVNAYLHAHYQLGQGQVSQGQVGPTLPFRIGTSSPALTQLLWRLGAVEAAFITACNPHGQPLSRFANRRLMTELERQIHKRRQPWLPGFGSGEDWPAEPSLLLPGIGRSAGDELARRFWQHGWVLLSRHHPPRLVLLR